MNLRLYEACETGNLPAFRELINEDRFILREVMPCSGDTPLHTVARFGHATLTSEILKLRPDLAHSMNHRGLPPMHLVAANMSFEVFDVLLEADPDKLCFLRDKDGRTPVHYAAMSGDRSMLTCIMRHSPTSAKKFLSSKIIEQSQLPTMQPRLQEIPVLLPSRPQRQSQSRGQRQKKQKGEGSKIYEEQEFWIDALKSFRGSISVVAALIATSAFTAGLSPPGGVNSDGQDASVAVKAHTAAFKVFAVANALALMLSISILINDITIIPLLPGSLKKLAIHTRHMLWASVAMLLVAFMSAAHIVLPHLGAHGWVEWCIWSLVVLTVLSHVVLLRVMEHFPTDGFSNEIGASGSYNVTITDCKPEFIVCTEPSTLVTEPEARALKDEVLFSMEEETREQVSS
ncbi:hypothetical protein AMTRI_Chr05g67060 [Amborella trichopoda]